MFHILSSRLLVLGAEESSAVPAQPGAELAELGLQARDGFGVHVGLRDHLGKVDDHAGEVFRAVAVARAFAFPVFVFARFPELADLGVEDVSTEYSRNYR